MFTKWSDIESWIRDNNFAHWVFTKSKPGSSEDKTNDKIVDSNYYAGDFEDKLAMTKKYLLLNGGRAYGVAWDKPNNTYNGAVCEVWLEADTPATPTQGVGNGFDADQLRESIRREMQAEWDKREYERKLADLEKREKQFEADKQSAIGLLTNYLAPVAKTFFASKRMVAGMDTDAPVTADPIPPIQVKEKEPDTQEPEQDDFTDEEIDQLNELMSRFKKVEPQYLLLIQKVVEMAESGDNTYCMAKNFLMKGTL